VAVRIIDYVVMSEDGETEVHRVRAYNPGNPVPPSAVLGDAEADASAWLTVGPDVRRRDVAALLKTVVVKLREDK
jgi:hypothetical protein